MSSLLIMVTVAFLVLGLGGAAMAFTGPAGASKKRLATVVRPSPAAALSARAAANANQQRRKNMQGLLKDLERQQAERNKRPTLQRRLAQAGVQISPRSFWIACGVLALLTAVGAFFTGEPFYVDLLAGFGVGLGLPRWIIFFLQKRRQKSFTSEFANAIDVIVRSVRSGLPTNEALKIVAKEMPEPVQGEFVKLCEGMKVGVSLDQGLKRMFENMPTPEVNFFAIVMTIQSKSGGNLSEALSNLASVLRERKRLQGKIKALSSEAKASAAIIGSLPPAVMLMVYFSTPAYIMPLFTTRPGNLMLAGCAIWMSIGIFVMKKMIAFKH
ncbi:MAG TPA: type II secretion system F family protein [Rhizomicrobium sp.]|jgi:tight adherence protein B